MQLLHPLDALFLHNSTYLIMLTNYKSFQFPYAWLYGFKQHLYLKRHFSFIFDCWNLVKSITNKK